MAASRPHRCPVAGVVMRWLMGANTGWVDAPQQRRRCLGCLAVPDGPEVVVWPPCTEASFCQEGHFGRAEAPAGGQAYR